MLKLIKAKRKRFFLDLMVSLVFVIYMCLQSMVYLNIHGQKTVIISQLIGLCIFGFFLSQGKMKGKWLYPVVLMFGAVFFSSVFVGRSPFGFGNLVNVISAAGVALFILRNRIIPIIAVIWVLFVVFFYFKLILAGIHPNYAHGTMGGKNAVSVHMLFVTVTIYIIYYVNAKSFPLFPALTFFFISLWAMGRGGILTSSILLASLLLVKLPNFFRRRNAIFSSFFLIVIVLLNFDSLTQILSDYIQLERTLDDVSSRTDKSGYRDEIAMDFLENSSIIDIIFGQDLFMNKALSELGGNAHNSFLALNSYVGLLSFFVFFMFIKVNFFLFRIRFELGVLMFVLFIRLLIEHVVWFSVFDFVPFLFLYLFMEMKGEMKKVLKS